MQKILAIYNIKSYSNNKVTRIKKRNIKRSGKTYKARTISGDISLCIPVEKRYSFAKLKGYGNLDTIKASPKNELINLSDAEIIESYNAEIRGFANYYSLAYAPKRNLSKLYFLTKLSLVKTLATKHKCRSPKVYSKLGKELTVTFKTKDKIKIIKFFKLMNLKKNVVNYKEIDNQTNGIRFFGKGSELIQRLKAEKCEYCRTTEGKFEVHHIKKLSNLKGKLMWEKAMIARKRKTLILCEECHDLLHAGKLSDKRYKDI